MRLLLGGYGTALAERVITANRFGFLVGLLIACLGGCTLTVLLSSVWYFAGLIRRGEDPRLTARA